MTRPSADCRAKVQQYVSRRFPDMRGVKPTVSVDTQEESVKYRFTFRKTLKASNGGSFKQIVHVTTDAEGKVLKVSASR
jgi:hypothetical protein